MAQDSNSTQATSSTADIVSVIQAQHRRMDALLEKATQEDSDTLALLQQVAAILIPHSKAEESFVYPAIEQRDPEEGEEVKDGTAEHHHIEGLLQELLGEDPDGFGYDGKLAAMVGELRHHVDEEEEELLPVLREKASESERLAMAGRFATETHWDTSTHAEGADGSDEDDSTKAELYEKAKQLDIRGRSTMSKEQLADAVAKA